MLGCRNKQNAETVIDEPAVEVVDTLATEEATTSDPKKFCTSQLEMFALVGDVHEVLYDSLHLVYNREGGIEFFGFNDSINLLQDSEYYPYGERPVLIKWSADGWKFENRAYNTDLSFHEEPMADFLIYYPEGGYDRYLTEFRYRPGYPKPEKMDHKHERYRKNAVSTEYRNFRRKGEHPRPDKFSYDEYVYDEYGNWIERRVKSEHRRTKNEKRIITYYSKE